MPRNKSGLDAVAVDPRREGQRSGLGATHRAPVLGVMERELHFPLDTTQEPERIAGSGPA